MDIDDDDDFYAPEEPETTTATTATTATTVGQTLATTTTAPAEAKPDARDDLEEGEEEDESGEMDEDDSDIEIVTERKDGSSAAPPPPTQSKYSEIRNIPSRTATSDAATKPAASVKDGSQASVPPQPTSTIDIDGTPVYKPVGKPITSLNIDDDLSEKEKAWRKPGTDLSDYFNYGFDEFSWTLYADKQAKIRGEYSQDAMAERTKKMMEEMNSMMMMPAGMGNSMAGNMSGMDGMTPEVQAMMQQMMASGIDPSQMDPSTMAAMFAGMQNPGAGGGSGSGAAQGAGQNQGFGNQGFGGNQGQGYGGYDQGGGGMNRGGGFGGRGNRGGRRNW